MKHLDAEESDGYALIPAVVPPVQSLRFTQLPQHAAPNSMLAEEGGGASPFYFLFFCSVFLLVKV